MPTYVETSHYLNKLARNIKTTFSQDRRHRFDPESCDDFYPARPVQQQVHIPRPSAPTLFPPRPNSLLIYNFLIYGTYIALHRSCTTQW
jgi:hypothetical protein